MNAQKCACKRFQPGSSGGGQNRMSPYKVNDVNIVFVDSHSDLGVEVHKSLKFHNHIRKTSGMCNGLTTNLLASTLCREAPFLMNVYLTHIRHKLEYCCSLWNMG